MSNSASLDRVGSGTGSVVDISPNTSTEDMTELAINQLHDTAESTAKEPQRSLPDRNVTADNFEDAYVQFIFYCNPSVPLLLPTAELRRGFKAVPRADGKFFETYTLFKLVQKLESGEISTWNSLVVELGVERPDPAKNQSTQKLGQYAVRCKRWLHAHHIDAFFHYLLGKNNEYYLTIPTDSMADPTLSRDGVATEEDLALRALLPNLRPKRGRRRDDEEDKDPTPSKRPRKETPAQDEQGQRSGSLPPQILGSMIRDMSQPISQDAINPNSQHPSDAYPKSAFPAYNHDTHMASVWASAQRAFLGSQATPPPPQFQANAALDWGGLPKTNASWQYPQSAIEPYPPSNPLSIPDGSQSAHPLALKSTPKTGKKAGRNVSASWNSSSPPSTSKTGRPRGRPPNYRSDPSGPYATFPSQQNGDRGSQVDGGASSPIVVSSQNTTSTPQPPYPSLSQKPSKLSLQVPQHEGGNVRLATPPPKVMVNGGDSGKQAAAIPTSNPYTYLQHERRTSADFFNSIDDEASEIADDDLKDDSSVNWKRRALVLQRKLQEAHAELKAVKRRVMEAVM